MKTQPARSADLLKKSRTWGAAIIVFFVTTASANKSDQLVPLERIARPAEIQIAAEGYVDSKPQAAWLIAGSAVEPLNPGLYEQSVIADQTRRLQEALDHNSVIPVVALMQKRYRNELQVCIQDIVLVASHCYGNQNNPGDIRVLLYPEAARRTGAVKTLILYEGGTVFIPLLADQDPVWYGARFLHELLHANQHRVRSSGTMAPRGSWAYTRDEVEAHGLAGKVLDTGTSGKYFQVIADVARSKQGGDISSIASSITVQDLDTIDSLFKKPSADEASNRVLQYILDVLSSWIRQRHSGNEALKMEIDSYLMATNF